MSLSDSVYAPIRLKNWDQVCEGYRKWEAQMEELENLTESRLGDEIKAQALLRSVPVDLREMAFTQSGLEGSFDQLKEYVLSQVGRRSVAPKSNPPNPESGLQQTQTPAPTNMNPN